jgi:RNA polymerase sigma-70 factor (ECF subfamily)
MDRFAAVYEEHVWRVYGFFAYRVRGRDLAEDLTQTTFEKALRAWPRFDPGRAAPATWLLAIARNVLIDHVRAARGRQTEELRDDHHPTGDEPALIGLDPLLAEALADLSARDREVLALRFGADLTGPEIAEALGLSLANVQQIQSRALRKLREALPADAAQLR